MFCFVFVVLFSFFAHAQSTDEPVLVVRVDEKEVPLHLTEVEIENQIIGFLVQTKMTMVFYNPNDRQMEGNLYFPLPEGTTIGGYALDVNGVMVEGVAVEKAQARIAFEKEVRKGVDPGLVEWVKGNRFQTRIYPIPAKGTRKIAVHYTSRLDYAGNMFSYEEPISNPYLQ